MNQAPCTRCGGTDSVKDDGYCAPCWVEMANANADAAHGTITREQFDAIMWGWCTPRHEAIATHGNRTGDLHA